MKVLFLNIHQDVANRGAETFVSELSKRLKEKHEVIVISGNKSLSTHWPVLWRFFIDPQSLLIGWFTLKNLPEIYREKPDIVIPLNGGWQSVLVRLITWIYGGRMIITGQSGKGWADRTNLWSFPDVFVALSSRVLKWTKRVNPLVRSKYIPNGVDLRKFNPSGSKYETKLKKPIVLCVAALTPSKRIDLTMKAVAKLKDASLLIAGSGDPRRIRRLGKKLLGKRFELVQVPFQKMPEIYRVADVFTLVPEGSEAFGIAYVEAMATNLPVVAIDDEQRREIIGKVGILVDPTDTDTYAKMLNKALSKKWGDKPRKQAEKFDWDKVTSKYERLFFTSN
jgi:glycosyltransferase involved in cell wall biosynthesis